MGGLLKIITGTIGIKKLFGLVWGLADAELKKFVASTSNEYDDTALKVVEQFVEQFLAN